MKLDDVAISAPERNLEYRIREVGLENVQSQVQFAGKLLIAKSYASVSLIDKKARGIHMSRLYKILNRLAERELSWSWLEECVAQMLSTHGSLSDCAHLEVHFEMPTLRTALSSGELGGRSYPITVKVSSERGKIKCRLGLRVLYSSTCPCSAGLSRQAMQDVIREKFKGETVAVGELLAWLDQSGSIPATPHAQRSEALCELEFDPKSAGLVPLDFIDLVERALGTPVQAAVKREDEQEFARRNAQNLMFCEDAARKIKAALMNRKDVTDFHIEVRHFESLHPHDVVAKIDKFD